MCKSSVKKLKKKGITDDLNVIKPIQKEENHILT